MKLIFFGAGFCSKFILESLEGFDEIICTHNLELTSQPFDKKLKIKWPHLPKVISKKDAKLKDLT